MKIELQFPVAGIKGLASTREASWMLCHDAIAAHAYQTAVKECLTQPSMRGFEAIDWIETRAAELLASYLDEGK